MESGYGPCGQIFTDCCPNRVVDYENIKKRKGMGGRHMISSVLKSKREIKQLLQEDEKPKKKIGF